MPKRKAGKMARSYDPIAPVAEEISEEACLLCFDEFQVIVDVSPYHRIVYKRDIWQYFFYQSEFISNTHFRSLISLMPWFSSSFLRICFWTASSLWPLRIVRLKVSNECRNVPNISDLPKRSHRLTDRQFCVADLQIYGIRAEFGWIFCVLRFVNFSVATQTRFLWVCWGWAYLFKLLIKKRQLSTV